MVTRRQFAAALGGAAAWLKAARTQQPDRVRRIGVLMPFAASDPEAQLRVVALENGLRARAGWRDATFALTIAGSAPPVMLAATDAVHAAIAINSTSMMNGAVTYRGTCDRTCDESHSRPYHAIRRITGVCTVHHSLRRPRSQHRDPSDYAHQSGR
jgi:hypothetical protein